MTKYLFYLAAFLSFVACSPQEGSEEPASQQPEALASDTSASASTSTTSAGLAPPPEKIPFDSDQWHSLSYSSLPANRVDFSSSKILIHVQNSASPLIYPMTQNSKKIKKISIKGHINSLIEFSESETQGQEGFDDFALRLGLVLLGDKRLNYFESLLAPDWVEQMFALAPEDQGIDRILFLTAVSDSQLLNQKRVHPLSEYLYEHYVWLMDQPGDFSYSYTFTTPQNTGALWISADGDDTQSSFQLSITEISLETVL